MTRTSLHAVVLGLVMSLVLAAPVRAASQPAVLSVESVLSPAWVERANGSREALAIGMALANGEKVHTGDGGRAMLRLAEGSAVKLGESALLAVDDLAQRRDAKRGALVSASLDVVRGAFRFTTGLLSKSNAARDVRVKVNAVTAGIRGTDVWGKSESERDVVCLLEGRISVTHGAAQFVMQEPMSFYIAPRQGQAQPPSAVGAEQVRQWSAETEIDARTGALRRGGTLSIVAGSARDERTAAALRDKLRDSGFPATIARAQNGYDVRIESLSDAIDAAVLAKKLQSLGYREARPAQ